MKSPRLILLSALLALVPAPVRPADGGWESLFDGRTLAGWKVAEHPNSPRVEDGVLVCEGKRAHVFYVGPDGQAEFENFELELEVQTEPGANSGVYFHTRWQDSGWPAAGFEAQVNNRQPTFKEHDYRENKKTGSLYGIRNLYKPLQQDGEWFTMNVRVQRPRVQIRLNGRLVTDYTEPANPELPAPGPKLNRLGQGTFALQCHDEDSRVRYRNIRVRRLPPGEDASGTKPVMGAQDQRRLALGKDNFPLVNLRVRPDQLTPAQLSDLRNKTGIFPGIVYAAWKQGAVRDDASALAVIADQRQEPVLVGLDVSFSPPPGTAHLSPEAKAGFDFLLAGTLPAVFSGVFSMEGHVAAIIRKIETEPIDVYANVMVLPVVPDPTEGGWTEARMQRVIAAAAKHGVAFEINRREPTPSEKFIRLAKAAGVKFTIGSETNTTEDYGDWSHLLEMQEKVGLKWQDLWVPGHGPTRAQRELAKK